MSSSSVLWVCYCVKSARSLIKAIGRRCKEKKLKVAELSRDTMNSLIERLEEESNGTGSSY